MSKQPKKYPEPKMYWHSNRKEVEGLKKVWDNGYDCKKCGHEFIALKITMTPSWEANSNSVGTVSLGAPKKKSGFFGKLIKYSVIFIIALIAFSIFFGALSESGDTEKQESPKEQPTQASEPKQEESILHQVFSEDAEKAAHENIPTEEDYKKYESIQNSTDQNDTLSIKTTIRESE